MSPWSIVRGLWSDGRKSTWETMSPIMQECFKDLGYSKAEFPHAEQASVNTLAIPIYPELTPAQRACVVEQIKEFYTAR